VRAKTADLDGELCGVGADGLPSFAETQAATDGERGARLVFYAFDLLHLDGRDTAGLPLIERKALLQPVVDGIPGLQFNGHETGDGELIRRHACQLGFEGIVSKTAGATYAPGNRGLWRKAKCLSAGIRRGRMDRSGGVAAASRRAFARLLHERRPTHLRRPGRDGHVRKGAQGSAPASRSIGAAEIALKRAALARHALQLAARSVPRHWVELALVAGITYLTWTADNLLRQTVYVGLREDKPADQVRRER
jgi:ATP-dependent DNA ligase